MEWKLYLTIRKTFYACLILLLFTVNVKSQSPSHTLHFSPTIDNNVNGFWEYLPRNYAQDVQTRYPLLIFIHGAGEQGSTPDTPTLNKVLRAGPPKLINSGNFPDSFNVGGHWHKFIVLSPQIKAGISGASSIVEPSTIEALIQYARSSYRVDDNRIYLCGLSMGGGSTWDYAGSSIGAARKLAAIIVAAGAADLTPEKAQNIAAGELPVLATHNENDNVIMFSRTEANIAAINSFSPVVPPRTVYWPTGGHSVWIRTFENIVAGALPNGNLTDTLGVSAYEWALQHFRPAAVLTVTWQSFTVRAQNNAAVLRWVISRAVNVKEFIVEKSRDGAQWTQASVVAALRTRQAQQYEFTDAAPGTGNVYYRIREVEYDGRHSYSPIKTFNAGAQVKPLVYPNPFMGEVRIDAQLPATGVVIRLADAAGRILLSQKHEPVSLQGEVILNGLERLAPGTYILTIADMQGQAVHRQQLLKR
jgi:predicted esterase